MSNRMKMRFSALKQWRQSNKQVMSNIKDGGERGGERRLGQRGGWGEAERRVEGERRMVGNGREEGGGRE